MPHHSIAAAVARLVVLRRRLWPDTTEWCAATELDAGVVSRVERQGPNAPLADVAAYADALGLDADLHVAPGVTRHKPYRSCELCGQAASWHPQVHVASLAVCLDEAVAPLVVALWDIGIRTEWSCQGDDEHPAHLVFASLEDARTFYAVVDRAGDDLRLRAGLRDATAEDIAARRTGSSWSHSVRWHVKPGSLLAEARCSVRFPADDLPALVRLANRPPAPALASLIRAARPV
jgi:hypothetical protein